VVDGFDPERARRARTTVWLALLASQVVYAGILVGGFAPLGGGASNPLLPVAFAALALGVAGGAHFFWRRASGAGRPLHAEPVDPGAAFVSYLLAWVLDESIGIYGFVLGVLGAPPSVWACFFAAAVALLLLHRPARD